MKNIVKKLTKNRLMYVVLLFLIIFLPSAIYLPAESDRRLVVSTVGLDKIEDEIEVSLLIAIPKSSGNIGNNFQLLSEKGETLSEALTKIGLKTGKSVSFAHCELIAVSDKILEENLATYLDFFIRTNNLTSNADIINAKNSKELLQANIYMSKEYSQTIKNVLSNNKKTADAETNNVDSFFKNYFEKSNCFTIPFVNVSTQSKNTESSNGGSSNESNNGSNNTQDETSSSGSGGNGKSGSDQESSSDKIITYDGSISILKNGVKVDQINNPENLGLQSINAQVKNNIFQIKNDYDNSIKDATVSIEVLDKKVKKNIQFINNTPYVTFDIYMFIKLDEIFTKEFEKKNLDTVFTLLKGKTIDKIEETINDSLSKTIEISKTNKVDIFDVVKDVYAYHQSDYKNFIKENNTDEDLIAEAIYIINYNFSVRN